MPEQFEDDIPAYKRIFCSTHSLNLGERQKLFTSMNDWRSIFHDYSEY
jgi:hypothetical protein